MGQPRFKSEQVLIMGEAAESCWHRAREHAVTTVFIFIHLFSFFLFIKAGNPKATRLCNVSDYGEIMLQNVMIGSCTENLETLETQVCLPVHLMSNWGTF